MPAAAMPDVVNCASAPLHGFSISHAYQQRESCDSDQKSQPEDQPCRRDAEVQGEILPGVPALECDSDQFESDRTLFYFAFILSMILPEKSATFRDHALARISHTTDGLCEV
jgi:hypothetical protein